MHIHFEKKKRNTKNINAHTTRTCIHTQTLTRTHTHTHNNDHTAASGAEGSWGVNRPGTGLSRLGLIVGLSNQLCQLGQFIQPSFNIPGSDYPVCSSLNQLLFQTHTGRLVPARAKGKGLLKRRRRRDTNPSLGRRRDRPLVLNLWDCGWFLCTLLL